LRPSVAFLEVPVGTTTTLRTLRSWLEIALALPAAHPGREELIREAATAFAEGFRLELDEKPILRRTTLGRGVLEV
jgi:hypothetical protein